MRIRSLVLLVLCVGLRVSAQQVASKDLTTPPPISPHQTPTAPNQNCAQASGRSIRIGDGFVIKDVPDKLELKIDSVSPNVLYPGLLITVTVSLKNVGEHKVSIPWQDTPVTPVQLDPADETTSYEYASLDLRLSTGRDHHDVPIYLKGDVSLEAAPNDPGQHVQLAPNQWVTITYAATVECARNDNWACRPFEADDHAVLISGWRERLSTRKEQGCSVIHGAFEARDLTSALIEVVFIAPKPARAN